MIRPFDGVGCKSYSSILISEKQKYFRQGSLTRHNCKGEVICPTGQIGNTALCAASINCAASLDRLRWLAKPPAIVGIRNRRTYSLPDQEHLEQG
jgi:hypothetical protein